MKQEKRINKKLLLFYTALLLLFACLSPTGALAASRTVKVAYPLQERLTDINQQGDYTGYSYEYLQEIAQYTGWNYEFVQAPGTIDQSLTALLEQVKTGQVDLMGGMLYTPQMAEEFDYSSHHYGTVETVLQAPHDSPHTFVVNSQAQQTLKVAVLQSGSRLRQELEAYCSMNLITPQYIFCETVEAQVQACREGRADVLLNTSLNYVEGVRTIARFAPKPFYFITAKGNRNGLLQELDKALGNIEQADPFFANTLYEKYFVDADAALQLSATEAAYVGCTGTLRVGMLTDQPPFQYIHPDTGERRGIGVDLLGYISRQTGLQFTFTEAATPTELFALVAKGQVDLIAGMPYNYALAQSQNVAMCQPYVTSQYVLMTNQEESVETLQSKRLALEKAYAYQGNHPENVLWYDSSRRCIEAVLQGNADYTYVDAYTAQYYINQPKYSKLNLVSQAYIPRQVCIALAKPIEPGLLNIINKAVVTIEPEELQTIIYQNTIYDQDYSLADLVWENPVEVSLLVAVVLLAVVALLLVILHQRVKGNKKTALALKKHLRVYALVSEYFFEYDYQTASLMISLPKAGGQVELLQYDCQKENDSPAEDEQQQPFFQFIKSRRDGVEELYLNCADGNPHWLRVALETVYDEDNRPAYAIGKINIIDEEKQEKDTLLAKAQLDSLTHILNAETSRQLITESLAALQPGEQSGLLILDLDYFKDINDNYGHLKGDEALNKVAGLLQSSFRAADIVGRTGGDEFVVYMQKVKSKADLVEKCTALGAKVRGLQIDGLQILSISIGVALAAKGQTYDEVYRRADQALYQAKGRGRDQFTLAP